jgi:hypothetical protein
MPAAASRGADRRISGADARQCLSVPASLLRPGRRRDALTVLSAAAFRNRLAGGRINPGSVRNIRIGIERAEGRSGPRCRWHNEAMRILHLSRPTGTVWLTEKRSAALSRLPGQSPAGQVSNGSQAPGHLTGRFHLRQHISAG